MPNLEKLDLCYNDKNIYELFDFDCLKNLKIFIYNNEDFQLTKIPSIEKIICHFEISYFETLEKFKNIKNLREIIFDNFNLQYYDLENIKDNNFSNIKELEISMKREYVNSEFLYNLTRVFPNLIDLQIYSYPKLGSYAFLTLKIKDNSEGKIIFKSNSKYVNIFIEPLENLEVTELNLSEMESLKLKTEKNFFFKANCKTIFKSLIVFDFRLLQISNEELKNLYKNIDNMPNLKEFKFDCYCNEIKEENHNKFIIKLLPLDLDFTVLTINKNGIRGYFYSLEELKNKFNFFKMRRTKYVLIYNIFDININKKNEK